MAKLAEMSFKTVDQVSKGESAALIFRLNDDYFNWVMDGLGQQLTENTHSSGTQTSGRFSLWDQS